MTARELTVRLLNKTFGANGFSNIVIGSAFVGTDISDADKNFCTALYYGVIERKITLDHIISGYYKKEKMDLTVRNILRCGMFQLKYMDSIPESAAINESVKLTRKLGVSSTSGLVNAILRQFTRDSLKIPEPVTEPVKYSAPQSLIDMLKQAYGEEETVGFLDNSFQKPPVFLRLNTFVNAEIPESFKESPILPQCYEFSGNFLATDAYKNGLFYVQNLSSQLCAVALDPKPGDTVLDLCAAPGGKSFTLSQLMGGKGIIHAFDLHENRVKLIKNGAKHLNIPNITVKCGNSAEYNENIPFADKILCDVPCSGLGVIRRKPEIKYREYAQELPELQYKILSNAAKYLNSGGELVYSTCTLNPCENEKVTERFLLEHTDFKGIGFLKDLGEPFGNYTATVLPRHFNSDGFFIAKFTKI
ncbi:MAG: 16S rRNA (cytosine(967)-C(5))-methyltransferase RsmB [Oscillospiraceae bacterium]|jgi:16S rRNA (cytosine967-C5)-methyltransferase|nr:16S rRNA (cytosine(967)-C(5))-methyltransferase RsmB [Oscillospiraceae bacterium]